MDPSTELADSTPSGPSDDVVNPSDSESALGKRISKKAVAASSTIPKKPTTVKPKSSTITPAAANTKGQLLLPKVVATSLMPPLLTFFSFRPCRRDIK